MSKQRTPAQKEHCLQKEVDAMCLRVQSELLLLATSQYITLGLKMTNHALYNYKHYLDTLIS